MIGSPIYEGAKPVYVGSLFDFALTATKLNLPVTLQLLSESLITRSRNRIVAEFLKNKEFTHLLFWDSDVGAAPEEVLRLLLADKDVVAGVYPLKHYRNGELEYPIQKIKSPDSDGFAEAYEATTGFMCIKRNVFENLITYYPDLQYKPENNPDSQLHYLFFDCIFDQDTKRYLSEDYAFCGLWRELGGKVFVDTRSRLQHQGSHIFKGDFKEYLDKRTA